jgi:shikimate kinase
MQAEQPIRQTLTRIVLIGFMGAGKSTIGPILAERLGWRFVDADHQLKAQTQTTIAELFTALGETAFRRYEAEVVAQLLQERDVVIALGGGAVEAESTRWLLEGTAETCVVFLKASLEVLIDRCERQPDAAVRPVLRQRETLQHRFHTRLPHYECAHITVDTEGLSPERVVESILDRMVDASLAISLNRKAIAT